MLQSQVGFWAAQCGAVVLGSAVNHVVGTDPKLINPSTDTQVRGLVLQAERGNFRVREGDHIASPPTEYPAATTDAGDGWLLIPQGGALYLPLPDSDRQPHSVAGFAGDSVLSWYWA